jgi:Secretion system C-terminal sorting domain/Cadherin domain
MKKIIFGILILLFSGSYVSGQSILSSVVSTSGNTVVAGGIEISWTLGDLVIETKEAGALIVTQGFQQAFINTSNNAPTDIDLSETSIDENLSPLTVIGDFSTTDADAGDTHFYSLVSGNGTNDAGNGSFSIDGNQLKSAVSFDYETQNEFHIYVQTTDLAGASFEKTFKIDITDVVETGINEMNQSDIKVYPNPSSEFIRVTFAANVEKDLVIELYDLEGRLIRNLVKNKAEEEILIPVSDLSASQYILKIYDSLGKEVQTFKLIKR